MAAAQLQILNKVLANNDLSIITQNNLTKDFFASYSAEYTFIINHYNAYHKVPDKLTFANTFKDFDFVECTEPDSYLLEQLFGEYNTNVMASGFNEVRKQLIEDNTAGAMQTMQSILGQLQHGSAMTCTNIMTDTGRYDRFLLRTESKESFYISTGFPELDKLIHGIDRKNENMVIAARTGIGKTWTLIKIAAAAMWQGLTVGFYSGEMTTDLVGLRLDTVIANTMGLSLNNWKITTGDLSEKAAYANYFKHLESHRDHMGEIKVITPNDIAGPATVDALRAFIEKEHLDILLVDQYSLLEDTSHAKQGFERVANISKAIKQLQVMKQIPIISVSQMNRTQTDNKEQSTTQIGLSDRIGQDATVVLMLDKVLDKDDPTKFFMTINVVKSRNGGDNHKLKYHADLNYGKFTYIGNENDKVTTQEDIDAQQEKYRPQQIEDEGFPY